MGNVDLLSEIRAQDAALERRRVVLWIGAEPTFTDRHSQDAWWLGQAEGGEKEARARGLLVRIARRIAPGAQLVRARGRVYPGEDRPRFCYGALWERGAPASGTSPSPEDAARADEVRLASGECDPVEPPAAAEDQAWLTVTPDPGVVEVNAAPAPDLTTFHAWNEAIYAAAADAGLSAIRYRYNGDRTDSGGGGQLTFGGPRPEASPFLARPQLLPRMVRYFNHHPSLSYAFAPDCAGSASQGPRPDEGVRERFDELTVTLDRLAARGDRVTPDELWMSLGPLLVDASGNSHRAELNVEKLWNPFFGPRGKLGLVELRSLRMPSTPARLTAVAALFRAVAARLATAPFEEPLRDWGGALHDMFGLPWFLRSDLEAILEDLREHGLGLGHALTAELLELPEPIARVELAGATLEISRAQAFWPLLGDVASQERAGARLVDSSSSRLQLLVSVPRQESPGTVHACGWRVPLHAPVSDPRRHVGSIVHRSFMPHPGLHPELPPIDPLVIHWERGREAVAVTLHGWRPTGGAYPGLPTDEAEAHARRQERVSIAPARPAPSQSIRGATLTLDLRRTTGSGVSGASPTLRGAARADTLEVP